MDGNNNTKRVHRLVLTGGPCSGKTTGQARLSAFFETMGWKVYRVPETATHLLSGGVEFNQMDADSVEEFQEDLLLCMIQTEETFFRLARKCKQNCLVICDRGTMDARAYMSEESWDRVLKRNTLNVVDLRDNRYDQIVHLVTAANGAEDFYNTQDNPMRTEGLELARIRDQETGEAWIGHPCLEIIDNSTDFDTKLKRMIMAVCLEVDIEVGDRLAHKITPTAIMELSTVLGRIDQLEKIVISQAREIEHMKIILKHNNLVLSTDHVFHTTPAGHKSNGPTLSNNNNNVNIIPHARQYNNVSPINRYSSMSAFSPHHYLMSPHVHPPSAIPPVGNSNNNKPTLGLSNTVIAPRNLTLNNNGFNFNSTNLLRSPPPTRVPPNSTALKRYTMPPLGSDFGLDTDEDDSTEDNSPDNSRHSRQNFVEQSSEYEDSRDDTSLRDANGPTIIDCCGDNSDGDTFVSSQWSCNSHDPPKPKKSHRTFTTLVSRPQSTEFNNTDQCLIKDKEKTTATTRVHEHEVTNSKDDHNKKLKIQQQNNSHDSTEITLISYTDLDNLSSDDLAEYLVGKVIDKSMVPYSDKSSADEAPYVNYNFRKIKRTLEEGLKENEQNDWPYSDQVPRPNLPEKLQIILKNSPFQ